MNDFVKQEVLSPFSSTGFTAADTASILASVADVTVMLDARGFVLEAFADNDELAVLNLRKWVGKPWAKTVTIESKPKIEAMLRDVVTHGVTRWRQVNLMMGEGHVDLPVQFRVIRLDDGERFVAIGRELRSIATMQQRLVNAQQLIEREYRGLRHADLRYRMLFQMASDAVLIIDMPSRRVTDCNPAALELFGRTGGRLNGRAFPFGFSEPSDREIILWLQKLLGGVEVDDIRVVIGADGTQCILSANLFRQDRNPMVLLRARSVDAAPDMMVVSASRSSLLKAAEALPDGVIVTESDGRIVMVNSAFLELAQLSGLDKALGESIDRWLGRPGVDIALLMVGLVDQGSVSLFSTVLRSEFGSIRNVEVSATVIPDSDPSRFAFAIRDVGLRLGEKTLDNASLNRTSMEHLTELVGRVPLKEILRETDDLIERMCIETALELSGDNRAMAAEMLGLSRQSLYVKMRRFGLGDLESL